jgi:hypothetical protein
MRRQDIAIRSGARSGEMRRKVMTGEETAESEKNWYYTP